MTTANEKVSRQYPESIAVAPSKAFYYPNLYKCYSDSSVSGFVMTALIISVYNLPRVPPVMIPGRKRPAGIQTP